MASAAQPGGYIEIGSTPFEEPCAQLSGKDQYRGRMLAECVAFEDQLRRRHGVLPPNVYFDIETFHRGVGPYAELVCRYADEESENFAVDLADNKPEYWDDEAKQRLGELGHEELSRGYRLPSERTALLAELARRTRRFDCISPITLAASLVYAEQNLDSEALRRFLSRNVRIIDLMIASIRKPEFQRLCEDLAECSDLQETFDRLGVSGYVSEGDWLSVAVDLQSQPKSCLYAMANFLAMPLEVSESTWATGWTLLSDCLAELGYRLSALYLLEQHLGIGPASYSSRALLPLLRKLERQTSRDIARSYFATLLNRWIEVELHEQSWAVHNVLEQHEQEPLSEKTKRCEWFESKAEEVLNVFPRETRDLLREFDALPEDGDVAPATLATFICFLYTRMEPLDDIANQLATVAFFRSTRDPHRILHGVVLPVCDGYRGQLPLPYWWWDEPYQLFFQYYLSRRLRVASEQTVRDELTKQWRSEDSTLHDTLLAQARVELPNDPLGLSEGSNSAASKALREYLRSVEEAMEERLAGFHPVLRERQDLLEIIHALYAIANLPAVLQSFDPELGERIAARLDSARQVLERSYAGLSTFEVRTLSPWDAKLLYLESCLQAKQQSHVYHPEGRSPLPENIGGRAHFPVWLRDYVFSAGGRIRHWSAGPIPYLFAAFEGNEPRPLKALGQGKLEIQDSILNLQLLYIEEGGDTLGIPFSFSLDGVEDLLDLALLVLAGWARVDLARITRDGELELMASVAIRLPETLVKELTSYV
ncbi:MAG: hypothetical protein AAF560_17855, partial [Acidobacteriota bacterium]